MPPQYESIGYTQPHCARQEHWVGIGMRWLPLVLMASSLTSSGQGFLDGTVAVVWHGVLAVPACHWQMAEALVATFGFWIGGMFFEHLHIVVPSVLQHRLHHPSAAPSRMLSHSEGANSLKKRHSVVKSPKEKAVVEGKNVSGSPAREVAEDRSEAAVAAAAASGSRGANAQSQSWSFFIRAKANKWTFFLQTKVLSSAVYLLAVACLHLSGTRTRPPLPQEPPTFLRFVAEVVAGLIAYDLLFSPIHWALHAPELRHKFATADAASAAATKNAAAATAAAAAYNTTTDKKSGRIASATSSGGASGVLVLLSNPLGWFMTRPFLSRCIAKAFSEPMSPSTFENSTAEAVCTSSTTTLTGVATAAVASPPAASNDAGAAMSAPNGTAVESPTPAGTVASKDGSSSGASHVMGKLFKLTDLSFAVTKLQRGLAGLRRSAAHGKHHTMKGSLQAGATVHHSLFDGGSQVLVNIFVQNQVARALFFDWPLAAVEALMSSWVLPTAAAWFKYLLGLGLDLFPLSSQAAPDGLSTCTSSFTIASATEEMELEMGSNSGVLAADDTSSIEWLSSGLPAWWFFVWLLTAPLLSLMQSPREQERNEKQTEEEVASHTRDVQYCSKGPQSSSRNGDGTFDPSTAAAEAKVDFGSSIPLSGCQSSSSSNCSSLFSEVIAVAGEEKTCRGHASFDIQHDANSQSTAATTSTARTTAMGRIRQHLQLLSLPASLPYWLVWCTLVVLGSQGHLDFCSEARHPMSRFAHNLAVTWLLCEAHCGYDLPWMCHRVWPNVWGGARAHNTHHNVGSDHLQQFFLYLDNAHGLV